MYEKDAIQWITVLLMACKLAVFHIFIVKIKIMHLGCIAVYDNLLNCIHWLLHSIQLLGSTVEWISIEVCNTSTYSESELIVCVVEPQGCV